MKKLKLLSLIILVGIAINIQLAEATPISAPFKNSLPVKAINNSTDEYSFEFSETNPKLVKVEARLTLQDSVLKMSNNGTMPNRWPQYIRDLTAFSENGQQLEINKKDSTAWIVRNTKKEQEILIRYNVIIDHEKQNWPGGIDGVAFVRDWGITASGRALFIINGELKTDIKVIFKKPKHWKISTPWEIIDQKKTAYYVANQTQLLESFVIAGTQEEVRISRDDFNINFVLGGELISKNKEHYVKAANKILDYYIDLMGGLPKNSSGSELSNVLVIMNQSKEMDGEVIGNNISMFLNPEANPQEQVISWFLFAHEFFHLWNGKSLRFKDSSSDWFSEGISNYYTIKALYNAELVNEEAIKAVLNQLFYARYINDPGFGNLAPSDAASGFDKDKHWGLIYGGGLFAGISMDMQIRHNTENIFSLDDLMRFFFKTTAGTENLINNQDLIYQANSLGHTDFTGFYNAYIEGTDEIPLNKYFELAGVHADTANNQLQLIHDSSKTDFQKKVWLGFLGAN